MSRSREIATLAIFGAVYFAAGKLGLSMAFVHGSVSPVWPPTGIALAGLLLLGGRAWPAVAVGASLVNLLTPVPLFTAVGIAIGNTLEALIGAFLLTRIARFNTRFERLRDVFALLGWGAGASTAVSASIGVASLCLGGTAPWRLFGRLWWEWWVGDAMGDLVIVPLILSWVVPQPKSMRHALEIATGGLGLLAIGWTVFGRTFDRKLLDDSYWLFPFVLWGALRFGPRGAATSIFISSAMAVAGTLRGFGPFVTGSPSLSLILLQAFMAVVAATGLVLGAITNERRLAQESLRNLNEELEDRVRARTKELATANATLSKTAEENEVFVFSVSHDLRSPLVNLEGFSQELSLVSSDLRVIVTDSSLPEAARARGVQLLDGDMSESIRFIQAAVRRLSGHIDALLRLSRAGRVEYVWQEVDVNGAVRRIVESMRATISTRDATVNVGGLPAVWGDPTAVEQLFANLVGNALHYLDKSRRGHIEIGCSDELAKSADQARVFFVKDNGVGIPDEYKAKLFRAGKRLHPELAEGEGLGLAIVRRVVERHRGRIWFESKEGMGTTFFVSLPTRMREE